MWRGSIAQGGWKNAKEAINDKFYLKNRGGPKIKKEYCPSDVLQIMDIWRENRKAEEGEKRCIGEQCPKRNCRDILIRVSRRRHSLFAMS